MPGKNNIKIEKVLKEFDFTRVHEAMKALNWEYRNEGVPDTETLRQTARELLEDAIELRDKDNMKAQSSTGGFTAKCSKKGRLTLRFVLEEYSTRL